MGRESGGRWDRLDVGNMAVTKVFGRTLLVMFLLVGALHQLYDPLYSAKLLEHEIPKWTNQPAHYHPYIPLIVTCMSAFTLVGCVLVLLGKRIGAWMLLVALLAVGVTVKNPVLLPGELQDQGKLRLDAMLHWGLVAGLMVAVTGNYGKEKLD